ncbi:hypothetical protein KSP40_PGU009908 [Platanthera guangdongensis]|uniref:E3 UFM1-protein ligase 1-like N-terminal domain-containing protein n=1 Tax=Platanthera guangdongensis TaxID=2320717 RepID=A0ABR2MH57_9ASPA
MEELPFPQNKNSSYADNISAAKDAAFSAASESAVLRKNVASMVYQKAAGAGTWEQLHFEMVAEIERSGRVSLVDFSDVLGVDLYHIEKEGRHIVCSNPGLMLVNGEIISELYWDGIGEEINEKLQESSQMSLAEIAAQLHVGSELVMSVLEPRLGTIVRLTHSFQIVLMN